MDFNYPSQLWDRSTLKVCEKKSFHAPLKQLCRYINKRFDEKPQRQCSNRHQLKDDHRCRQYLTHRRRFLRGQWDTRVCQDKLPAKKHRKLLMVMVSSTSKDEKWDGSNRINDSDSSVIPMDQGSEALAHLLTSKNIVEFIVRVPAWCDAQKESGMPQRQKRAFYSHEDWLKHRSSSRHMRHLLSSLSSRVIISLIPPVSIVTAISVVIAVYNTVVDFGFLPSYFPLLHASSLPYELTAPALALLLVFRTEASYSRYDEARKTWTSVISTTKDFARKSMQLIQSPDDAVLRSCLLAYIMAFPVALKCHLIFGSDLGNDLQHLLRSEDVAFVLAARHRPNCLIQLMSQTICLVQLDMTDKTVLNESISQYNASISVCERLIRTPIPLSYTRLTSRFLVLWHLTLPIILWDSCEWLSVPATFMSAASLFCIEEVGVLIEEPFPMLALDKIIGIAHESIWEMVDLQLLADKHLSERRKTGVVGSNNQFTNGVHIETKQYSLNQKGTLSLVWLSSGSLCGLISITLHTWMSAKNVYNYPLLVSGSTGGWGSILEDSGSAPLDLHKKQTQTSLIFILHHSA